MAKQERLIKEFKILDHPKWNTLRVKLYYDIGGMNYFTGNSVARGLKVNCSPLQVNSSPEGYKSTVYTGFSGVVKHVKDMARFSKKTFENYVPSPEDVQQVIDAVVNKNGLKIEEVCK